MLVMKFAITAGAFDGAGGHVPYAIKISFFLLYLMALLFRVHNSCGQENHGAKIGLATFRSRPLHAKRDQRHMGYRPAHVCISVFAKGRSRFLFFRA